MGLSESVVTVQTIDGCSFTRTANVGSPMADKAEQSRRVDGKFIAIASPLIGEEPSHRILDRLTAAICGASPSAAPAAALADLLFDSRA